MNYLDKLTQQKINQVRRDQRHQWATQATQNIKPKLDIHISSAPPVIDATTFFPGSFRPSETTREVIPGHLPWWLKKCEHYGPQTEAEPQGELLTVDGLYQLNEPNAFPTEPFWHVLRLKKVKTDGKGKPVIDPRDNRIVLEDDPEQSYQQSQSWLDARRHYEDIWWPERKRAGTFPPWFDEYEIGDGIYRGDPEHKRESGDIFACQRIMYIYRQERLRFQGYMLTKRERPRKEVMLKRCDKPKHEKHMKAYMKERGKHVQYESIKNWLEEENWYLWRNRLHCFMTVGKETESPAEFSSPVILSPGKSELRVYHHNQTFKQYSWKRSEDLESIMLDEVLHGKDDDAHSVKKYIFKGYIDDKMQTKKLSPGVDFISLPDNKKLEYYPIDQIRQGWEMRQPVVSEADEDNNEYTDYVGLPHVPFGESFGMWPDETKWHKAWVKALDDEPCTIMDLEKPWKYPKRCIGIQNRGDGTEDFNPQVVPEDLLPWVVTRLKNQYRCIKETDYGGQHYLPGETWDGNHDKVPKNNQYWKHIETSFPEVDLDLMSRQRNVKPRVWARRSFDRFMYTKPCDHVVEAIPSDRFELLEWRPLPRMINGHITGVRGYHYHISDEKPSDSDTMPRPFNQYSSYMV